MNKYTKLIVGIFVALGIILLAWSMKPAGNPRVVNREPIVASQPATESITLSVQDLWANKQLTISNDQTLLELLKELSQTKPEFELETKEYQGLGTLVTKLGTHTNGENNAYWQYYVNGEQPLVGADAYIPKIGDVIEWKFTASGM